MVNQLQTSIEPCASTHSFFDFSSFRCVHCLAFNPRAPSNDQAQPTFMRTAMILPDLSFLMARHAYTPGALVSSQRKASNESMVGRPPESSNSFVHGSRQSIANAVSRSKSQSSRRLTLLRRISCSSSLSGRSVWPPLLPHSLCKRARVEPLQGRKRSNTSCPQGHEADKS